MEQVRVETGPLRIGDDFCGTFIRGDNAMGIIQDLKLLKLLLNDEYPDFLKKYPHILSNSIDYPIELLKECIETDGKTPKGLQEIENFKWKTGELK